MKGRSQLDARLEISAFKDSDFDTLLAIDQECFPPGIAYPRKVLSDFIRHRRSKTWVARCRGSIIGFVVIEQEPRKVCHVITIDVIARFRGRGAGKALMKAAEGWVVEKGLRLIYLETAEDNRQAQLFYTSQGYAKVDEIANYYSNGQPAWLMVKWL